jgi:hypothetical protein
MEFENETNQSHEEVNNEQIDTQLDNTPVDTNNENQPPDTIQEEFDIIKYNKEDVRIPVAERQTYLQKGYHFDKVKTELDSTKQQVQYLDRLAKMSGYQTTDEFIRAVEQAEEQQRIQQQAEQFGVDEEIFKQHLQPTFNELSEVKQRLEQMEHENIRKQLDSELAQLQKDENFSKYENDMWEIAQKYQMGLTEAYEFASLRGLKTQIPDIQKQTEQRVVDQIRARQGKHVETSDENATVSLNLSPEEISMAEKMGLSPEEYAKWK